MVKGCAEDADIGSEVVDGCSENVDGCSEDLGGCAEGVNGRAVDLDGCAEVWCTMFRDVGTMFHDVLVAVLLFF